MNLNKSQVLFHAELNEAGSSSSLPLPVADEGRRGESPRSKVKRVPLVGACFTSGTASVIDGMLLLYKSKIETKDNCRWQM